MTVIGPFKHAAIHQRRLRDDVVRPHVFNQIESLLFRLFRDLRGNDRLAGSYNPICKRASCFYPAANRIAVGANYLPLEQALVKQEEFRWRWGQALAGGQITR